MDHVDPPALERRLRHLADTLSRCPRHTKAALQAAVDGVVIVVSIVFVMTIRLGTLEFAYDALFWSVALAAAAIGVAVLAMCGIYRMMVRFTSLDFVGPCMVAASAAGSSLMVISALSGQLMPRMVPLTVGLLTLVELCGYRVLTRLLIARLRAPGRSNVIIYGAGEAGRQLFQALRQSNEYRPVAFIDEAAEFEAVSIAGCDVHPPSQIGQIIARKGASHVLLALPGASPGQRNAILHDLSAHPVHVQTVPGMAELVSGKAKVSAVREIQVEDLLGRDTVPPDPSLLSANIRDRVVMVTGASGSIGSELCRQIVQLDPATLVLLEISEVGLYTIEAELQALVRSSRRAVEVVPILGSIRDGELLARVMSAFGVQTVYHAAAYKHVPIVEENVIEGVRNNIFGTASLARAAVASGVEVFVMISTDKAVRPTNVMGASKRLAELVCQEADRASSGTRFTMVRFGNVLGSSGSVVPRFSEQIRAGGPVTVTHPDVTRYFMTIPEAAQLVIQAGAMGRGGDVFLLDMGEPVRIVDLAVRMIRLAGLRPYLLDGDEVVAGVVESTGDIGITFCGLRHGEKLYEELLIGDNPQSTDHARIMKANEIAMAPHALAALLADLERAAAMNDVAAIRAALEAAPLGYCPSHNLADLAWKRLERPQLRLVARGL